LTQTFGRLRIKIDTNVWAPEDNPERLRIYLNVKGSRENYGYLTITDNKIDLENAKDFAIDRVKEAAEKLGYEIL
jgi:hypothetical protein